MTSTVDDIGPIGFIGAGTVGTVLGIALSRSGYHVSKVASRTRDSADTLATAIPICNAVSDPTEVADTCDLVFLTVPDDAIREVAASVRWRATTAVVHCSGATPLEALAPALDAGAVTGAFHPLQTFAAEGAGSDEVPSTLPGSSFGIEAPDPALRTKLHRMAADLDCEVIDLKSDTRALYHVSAVMASNHLVTLIADAAGLWGEFGLDRSSGLRALLPLVRGTVRNLEREGLPAALTGPVARGDVGTVKENFSALEQQPEELVAVHRAMTRRTLRLAREKGQISEGDAAGILALLEGGAAETKAGGDAE